MDTFDRTQDWISDTWEDLLCRSLINSGEITSEFLARKQAKEIIATYSNHLDCIG